MNSTARRVLRAVLDAVVSTTRKSTPAGTPTPKGRPAKTPSPRRSKKTGYPGDYSGEFAVSYAPSINRKPDPGEIVWTWVPYEEDASQGKDRPVLLVGRDGKWLLGLMLTSKDHDRDAADEARWGRHWMDLGSGPWDSRGRPSEVRLDRVIRINPARVRREGAILDAHRFDAVIRAVRETNGW